MRIYFLPTSESGLEDRIFESSRKYEGGLTAMPFWDRFKAAAQKMGIETHTHDLWDPKRTRDGDVLVVQNHPGETLPWRTFYFLKHMRQHGGFILDRRRFLLKNYKHFSRRVLLQTESPMIMPYTYRNLERIRRADYYHKIFLLSRRGEHYDYFNYYDYREKSLISPYFDLEKNKFLAMVNANMTLHSFKNELYGERLRAIRYFSGSTGFDLYGYDWDKAPRHPFYLNYGQYVKKVWRGSVPHKIGTVGQYNFVLCFENCSYPGYVTEKIYDCLAAGSIPVYLGAPDIETIVPADCFIDFRKFKDYDALHRHLSGLSEGDIQKYRRSIKEFLNDNSTIRPMEEFVKKLVGQ